jgi:hypothetical protein
MTEGVSIASNTKVLGNQLGVPLFHKNSQLFVHIHVNSWNRFHRTKNGGVPGGWARRGQNFLIGGSSVEANEI